MRLLKEKAGFILVELIIATAILAAVIPLSKFFMDTIRASNETKIQQTANHIAQQYLEEYKAKDMNEITAITNQVEIVNGKEYKVSVALEWLPIEIKGLLGTVTISKDTESGIDIELSSLAEGSPRKYHCLSGSSHTLKFEPLGSRSCMKWGTNEPGVELPNIADEPKQKQLNLIVIDNPSIEVNIKNRTKIEQLLINKTEIKPDSEASNFKIYVEEDLENDAEINTDVIIRDTEQVGQNELGVNIIVTVNDADNHELVKIAETRKIEW
ncbi:MAG: type II secretion system protein [Clostridia bacterium]|nr:type II secretion system protein [Clostridia bacterium]